MGEAPLVAASPGEERGRPGLLTVVFVVGVAVILAADLISKAWAWSFLDQHGGGYGEYAVFGEWFRLAKATNTGTIWGLFKGYSGVLTGVRCVMVLVLLAFAWFTPACQRFKLSGFALTTGGALGNLHDNVFREDRGVRDFLDFHVPLPWRDTLYHYPTFNIADAAILVGAISLFIAFGREGSRSEQSSEQSSAQGKGEAGT